MADEPADHDRYFKDLLKTFFFDFIELFLPAVSAYLRPGHVEFLEQEIFTDITSRERHEVDLLAKVRFRESDAFFLIHVENQASAQADFAKRMFRYFARLHEKYDLPVYPIALLSFDSPLRAEPEQYRVEFPDRRILEFSFQVIQLNRLNWRQFLDHPNPVSAALMTKMRMTPEERVQVKLECLRMIATLRLDAARSALLFRFMGEYLRLNTTQAEVYNRSVATIIKPEEKHVMSMSDALTEDGALHIILRMIKRRFGPMPYELEDRVRELRLKKLEAFSDAILDFKSLEDVAAWLDANA